jgi:hypothetical protein
VPARRAAATRGGLSGCHCPGGRSGEFACPRTVSPAGWLAGWMDGWMEPRPRRRSRCRSSVGSPARDHRRPRGAACVYRPGPYGHHGAHRLRQRGNRLTGAITETIARTSPVVHRVPPARPGRPDRSRAGSAGSSDRRPRSAPRPRRAARLDIDLPLAQARCCQVRQNDRLVPVQPGGRRSLRGFLGRTGFPAHLWAGWPPGWPATNPGDGGLAADEARDAQPAPPRVPPTAPHPCPAVLPEMVRLPPDPRVISSARPKALAVPTSQSAAGLARGGSRRATQSRTRRIAAVALRIPGAPAVPRPRGGPEGGMTAGQRPDPSYRAQRLPGRRRIRSAPSRRREEHDDADDQQVQQGLHDRIHRKLRLLILKLPKFLAIFC